MDESAVPEYSKQIVKNADGTYTITNTHTPEKVNVSVKKVWNDANNQDGDRPATLTVTLKADGVLQPTKTVTLTKDDNWALKTISNLPKWKYTVGENGSVTKEEIAYTWEEGTLPEGYSLTNTATAEGTAAQGTITTLTNSQTPGQVSVSVEKTWVDSDNADNIRPASIQVQLYANDVAQGSPVTLDSSNLWKHTWTGLDEKANGQPITYTVDEVNVPNFYTKTITGTASTKFIIINSHTPAFVNVSGVKEWVDNNNEDQIRPSSVTVILKADGVQKDTTTATAAGSWAWSFTNLPKYKFTIGTNGSVTQTLINYEVDESAVPEYTTNIVKDPTTGAYTITNTHVPEKVNISGVKEWADNNNEDQIRPASVTVILKADGAQIDSKTATAAGNWAWSFTNLPKYKFTVGENGSVTKALIEYDVDESAVPEYTTNIVKDPTTGAYTITNTHVPEKVNVTVKKVWNDTNNQDGVRPATLTVTLKADEVLQPAKTVTLTAASGWAQQTISNLPKYKFTVGENGSVTKTAIAYTWEEGEMPEGYSLTNTATAEGTAAEGTITTLTNYRKVDKTSVFVEKAWVDNENEDGIRPASIQVQLYANGAAKGNPVTLNAANSWKHTWEDLDAKANGVAIAYTVEEVAVPAYYEKDITGSAANGYTITNTHKPAKIGLKGVKEWADNNNEDQIRPAKVTVILKADGKQVDTTTATEASNWTWSFTNLPKYRYTIGTDGSVTRDEIIYNVDESAVPEYETEIVKGLDGTYKITNKHVPEKVNVTVKKVWNDANDQDGMRPEDLVITLKADGTSIQTVTLTAASGWAQQTVSNLPKYKFTVGENGSVTKTVIAYTWAEEKVPEGYRVTSATSVLSTETEGTITTLTNIHAPRKTHVSVEKVWEDAHNEDHIRPASVQVQLYANGAPHGEPVILSAANGWRYTWTNLDERANGKTIAYTVDEVKVPDHYAKTISGSASAGYVITNTHVPEKVNVTVKKAWDDAHDQDGIRPHRLVVTLKADGQDLAPVRTVLLTAANGWAQETISNLPKYKFTANEDGSIAKTEIAYTWAEESVPAGYSLTNTAAAEGTAAEGVITTLTNTHAPRKTEISVEKVWHDANNEDAIRPASIQVQLFANGNAKGEPVTLNAENGWKYTWTGLDERSNGRTILYTVDETAVPAYYVKSITGTMSTGYTITNTHLPEKVNIRGVKVWADQHNEDGIRPASVTVILKADGKQIDTTTATAGSNWAWSFTNLPQYKFTVGSDNSVTRSLIIYTVDESAVPEYATRIVRDHNGIYVITNTHVPEKVNVTIQKLWNDAHDQDGKRPDTLVVTLKADGEDLTHVTLTRANLWARRTIPNLPKYKFTVAEDGAVSKTEIVYTWVEGTLPEGYSLTSTTSEAGTPAEGVVTTLTNSYTPAKTSVTVTKVWKDSDNQDGARPESIKVQLYANGAPSGEPVTLVAGSWQYTWTELDAMRGGHRILYTVKEVGTPSGYTLEGITGSAAEGFVITNKHVPDETEATIIKVWNDANDQDGLRPANLVVTLSNGTEVVLNEGNNWRATVEKLPKYEDGKLITYTWTEGNLPEGYTLSKTSQDGTVTTLTNSHTPQKTSVTVTKEWKDRNDEDRIRPKSVQVQLYADGEAYGEPVELTAPSWKYTWTNLDAMKAGQTIDYTVKEVSVPKGYKLDGITGNAADGFVITNKHTPSTPSDPPSDPEKIDIKVTKVWKDSNNKENLRPNSITVNLFADGTQIASRTIVPDADGNWEYTFTGLDKYKAGKRIEYTITEDPVEGYTTTIQGYVVTNTHTPDEPDEPDEPPVTPPEPPVTPPEPPVTPPEPPVTPPDKPEEPKLPQTGLLLWPTMMLAAAGFVLTGLGWRMRRKSS